MSNQLIDEIAEKLMVADRIISEMREDRPDLINDHPRIAQVETLIGRARYQLSQLKEKP